MKTIIVGVPTSHDATNEFVGCLAELRRKNLLIRNAFRIRRTIDTANCRIMFISKSMLDYIRGYYCDICFGFTEEEQCRLNWSHEPTDYNGTFLDYVYKVEGIKE